MVSRLQCEAELLHTVYGIAIILCRFLIGWLDIVGVRNPPNTNVSLMVYFSELAWAFTLECG